MLVPNVLAPGGIPDQMSIIGADAGVRLVEEMDTMLEDLKPLQSFILPTGNPVVASLHVARTIVRRAERGLQAEKGDQTRR